MIVRTALVDKRTGTAIISSLSRSLAIIASIAIASQVLGSSVHRAATTIGMIGNGTISWLGLPLAIISTISIASQALSSSVHRAAAPIGVKSYSAIAIARLSGSKGGDGGNN